MSIDFRPVYLHRLRKLVAPFGMKATREDLAAFNVERVRGYCEKNIGASRTEIAKALELDPRTVFKAIEIIRGQY